jgi:ATP-binding cassette, subfamily B, bacterial MsbA
MKMGINAMLRIITLGRPHWALLGWALICMVVLALMTSALAFLLGPLLRFVLTGGQTGLGFLAAIFPNSASASLWYVLPATVIAVGLLKGLGYFGQFYLVGLFAQRLVVELRQQLFQKLLSLSPQHASKSRVGELVSYLMTEVGIIEQAATYTLASWIRDSLAVLALAAVAFYLSPSLTLVLLLLVPLAAWPVRRLSKRLVLRTRLSHAALGQLAAHVQEGVTAIKTIQAYQSQSFETDYFHRQSEQAREQLLRAVRARAAVPALMEVFAAASIALILAWALQRQLVAADVLLSFLSALILLYQPAKDLGRVSQFATAAGLAFERLDGLINLAPDVTEGPQTASAFTHQLELKDVTFCWTPQDELATPALHGVSLSIKKGQVLAVVGESGSGKSTLAKLLLRLIDPQEGAVVLDGQAVPETSLKSYRKNFALVSQEPLVFSGTVRDNICLGHEPVPSQGQLESACQRAGAHDFIHGLPLGYDTPVGERGALLSQGQKQRVCIARALLSQAPILIFDEPTANLDAESARRVEETIFEASQGLTAVVIAHSLHALSRAHVIAVLHEGRLVQLGRHDELMRVEGRYRSMNSVFDESAIKTV